MKKNKPIYIYALINPLNSHVFYIGATKRPYVRRADHVSSRNFDNSFKNIQIRNILDSGEEIELLILDECELSKASFWEEFYLELFLSFGFNLPQKRISTYTPSMFDSKIGFCYKSVVKKGNTVYSTLKYCCENGIVTYCSGLTTSLSKHNDEEIKEFMINEAKLKGFQYLDYKFPCLLNKANNP